MKKLLVLMFAVVMSVLILGQPACAEPEPWVVFGDQIEQEEWHLNGSMDNIDCKIAYTAWKYCFVRDLPTACGEVNNKGIFAMGWFSVAVTYDQPNTSLDQIQQAYVDQGGEMDCDSILGCVVGGGLSGN